MSPKMQCALPRRRASDWGPATELRHNGIPGPWFRLSLIFKPLSLCSLVSIGIRALGLVSMLRLGPRRWVTGGHRRGSFRRRWSVEQAPVFARHLGCFAPEHRLAVLEIRSWSGAGRRRVRRLGSTTLLLVVNLLLVF